MSIDQYRKTPRADWIDYDNGIYFVTTCTKSMKHFFGAIFNNEMHLSEIGRFVDEQLRNADNLCDYIEIPLYVVMPNHIHLLIYCKTDDNSYIPYHPAQRSPDKSFRNNPAAKRYVAKISRYMSSFKGAVTKFAKNINPDFEWEERYHDHLIRNMKEGNIISEYIRTNVQRWNSDCYY